jgi:hypothetical protein
MKNLSKLPNFRWCAGDEQQCGSGQIPPGGQSTLVAISQVIDSLKAKIQNGSAANAKHTTVLTARPSTTRSRHASSINDLKR